MKMVRTHRFIGIVGDLLYQLSRRLAGEIENSDSDDWREIHWTLITIEQLPYLRLVRHRNSEFPYITKRSLGTLVKSTRKLLNGKLKW